MWISKIELTNFKSYRRATFEFPEPADGKNIVLVGGMNGFGKTTLLEGLYLCLYGKDAIVHLARAGLKTDETKGYPTFLEKALNGEAKRDGADQMSVRIVINQTRTKGVDILRRWYFRSPSGEWTKEDEAVVREIVRNMPQTPKTDGQRGFLLSELLDDQFVPAHVAPFFFFDGEEVKKLADQSRIEQVKQGLEGLLGVVLLRNLAERLQTFESQRRGQVSTVDEENLQRLLESLTASEAELTNLRNDAKASVERREQRRLEREALIERFTAAGGGGGEIATVKELVEEREQLRTAHRDAQRALERIISEKLPFHLMPRQLVMDFRHQLKEELRLAQWQSECRALQPRRQQFEDAFLGCASPEIRPDLTAEQLDALKVRIESAWASLFHPPPDGCAREVVHSYLHERLKTKAIQFVESLTVGREEVETLLSDQRSLLERIDELTKKISRVEGIDKDGTINQLRAELARVTADMDALDERIREDERKAFAVETTVNQTRARYEQEKGELDSSSPVRALIEKSERVRTVIEEVIPRLFPLKVAALQRSMTKVYKQLAHKSIVDQIVVDEDGTARILSKTGKEIYFDRSSGENQIFATALIAGLAEVSGIRAPLVVDTPLGRLDSRHRQNILQFWTSDKKRQVILLSQDKEIDTDYYEQIQDSVSATYLLEHTDVGDGIGRTVVKPGLYFGAD